MDFEMKFSAELEAFRAEVSAWLDQNAPKLLHVSDPRQYTKEDHEKRVALRRALGQKGWLFPTGPKQYGGGGLTVDHAIIIAQELEKREIHSVGTGENFAAACTLVWGTEEQKQAFAVPILKGEATSWQLLTEPQGGSDLASAKTMAIRDGDDYVVNGQKIFVGNEWVPEYFLTIVNTDPQGARHRNLSYLLIPSDLPGITIQPLYLLAHTGGETPELHKNIVFFDDVRVPVFNRIGEHNEGWKVASTNMELEHGGGGNISTDLMLERLITSAKQLQYEGKPLIEDPATRAVLAEVIQEREIARLWGARNYWLRHSRTRMEHEGPQYSYWRKSRAHSFSQHVHDTLGHYAIQRDPKYVLVDGWLELQQREVFVTVHGAGGLNIQATIVARRLGIGRNVREEAGALPGSEG